MPGRRFYYFDEQAESFDELLNPPLVIFFLKITYKLFIFIYRKKVILIIEHIQ